MDSGRLIILDRDGVINRDSDEFIKSPEEWEALPGSLEAIARLCRAEYRVVVVTNQSGISRGLLTPNTLNRIHQKMLDQLHALGGEIDAIFFCPHGPDDQCDCRKPLPGMFEELKQRLKCSPLRYRCGGRFTARPRGGKSVGRQSRTGKNGQRTGNRASVKYRLLS